MNFAEAVDYLSTLRRFGVKLGNERFERLLQRMGNPHRAGYSIAHIAGTKGKGSTTAMTASLLTAHGRRTGGYYSPYVYDIRERVQIDGEMISREDFARHMTQIAAHIEAMAEEEVSPITEFEAKTALGLLYFAESRVDAAAIEVGMGGRLDATNVVSPDVCIITNIGLDHMHILGDTHAKIAFEKAGIVKPCIPLVTAVDHPDALQVILQVALERDAPVHYVARAGTDLPPGTRPVWWQGHAEALSVTTERGTINDIRVGLLGSYQAVNAACAVAAVEQMCAASGAALDPDSVRTALRTAYVPGRFEIVRERPRVVLDGAHNELAARALAAEISRHPHKRLLLVLGMVAGHEPHHVAGPLASLAHRVYVTQPLWRKALSVDTLARVARTYCADVVEVSPPEQAVLCALEDAGPSDLVLVTGSFYTIGDVPRRVFQ